MGKETIQCDNCDAELQRWPSHISDHNFCDRDCHSEWQSRRKTGKAHPRYSRVLLECDWCGDKLERIQSRAKNYERQFCDGGCKGDYYSENPAELHNQDRVTVNCATCGSELERRKHRVEQNERHFCDRECKGQWWSEHVAGEDHPNWQGGFDDYYGENWPQQRRRARKREQYRCFFCGLHDGACQLVHGRELEVHHVQRKDDFDDLGEANRIGNLLTLCRRCHHSLHNTPTLANS